MSTGGAGSGGGGGGGGGGVQWLDAQPFLERVCDQMSVGELLHGESFSLYDSMTAIEIGVPKMDLGLRRHQDVGTPEDLIASGHAPIDLSVHQLLALMDQLTVMEAAWHCGGMLPQTVYTSLYMLQVDRLAGHPVLHAFCLAMRTACTAVRDLIVNGQVCEDEDFSIYTFGVNLDPPGPAAPHATLKALHEVEEYLAREVKKAESSPGGGGRRKTSAAAPTKAKPIPGMGESFASPDAPPAACSSGGPLVGAAAAAEATRALLARVRFRRLFHQILQHIAHSTRADVEAARTCCQAAMEELQLVLETVPLGASCSDPPGFVPEINRKHMGLVPPRPVKALTREEAVGHFSSLVAALAGVCSSLLTVQSWEELEAVLVPFAAQPSSPVTRSAMHLLLSHPIKSAANAEATAALAASRGGGSGSGSGSGVGGIGGAVSPRSPRSVGSVGSSSGGGGRRRGASGGGGSGSGNSPGGKKGGISSALQQQQQQQGQQASHAGSEPPRWCATPRMVCSEFGWVPGELPGPDVEMFAEQCAIAMQGWVHTMCLNRCRQRRRLRHLLEDWRNMFDHGLNADTSGGLAAWMAGAGWRWTPLDESGEDPQGPVATWVERESCKTMVAHLMLGFALGLYLPYELRAVYWYCDYLLGTQQQATKILNAARPPPAAAQRPRLPRRGGVGSPPAQLSEEGLLAEQRKTLQIMSLEIERLMCQGMMKMATGLTMLGCLEEPEAPFNGEEQRFIQRFGLFHILTRPMPLSYDHLQHSMKTGGLPADAFFAMAFEQFFKAQHGAAALLQGPTSRLLTPDQVNHLNGVKRVAAQNSMALKIMIAALRREAEQQRQLEAQQAEQGQQAQQPEGQQEAEGGKEKEQQQQQQQQRQAQQPQQHNGVQQQAAEAAAAGKGEGERQQGQQQPQRQLFNVSWDYNPSLQSSVSMFYPVIALRTASSSSSSSGSGGGSSSSNTGGGGSGSTPAVAPA